MICNIFNFSRFVSLPSKLRFLFLALIITSLIIFIGCSDGASGEGEECEEGSTSEECTGEEEPPAGSSTLTCVSDEDCDGYSDTCDADSATAYDATTGGTPYSTTCDADQDGHLDADCTTNSLTAGDENCDTCIGESNPDQGECTGEDYYNCSEIGGDDDGDTICGNDDNCPDNYNSDQADKDSDGIGDSCDSAHDMDGDGYNEEDGDCDDEDASINPGSTQEETVGGEDYNCDGSVGDVENAVFVDGTYAANGDGSFDSPFNNLADGVSAAEGASETKDVYVYYGSLNYDTSITITGDIRIYGGVYCVDDEGDMISSADCESTANLKRDTETYKTTINGSEQTSDHLFSFESGASGLLDGFEITGPNASEKAAIYIWNSSPTISNSKITSITDGTDPEASAWGIYIKASDDSSVKPIIENCTINVAESSSSEPGSAIGIYAYSSDGESILAPTIQNSSINVGKAEIEASGIYIYREELYAYADPMKPVRYAVFGSGVPFISGGKSVDALTTTVNDNYPSIIDNTIVVDEAEANYGIKTYRSAVNVLRNDMTTAGKDYTGGYYSYGVVIEEAGTKVSTLYNNLIKVSLAGTPLMIRGIKLDNAGASIYNNTISLGEHSSSGGQVAGLYLNDFGSHTIQIVNNIFTTTDESTSATAIYESDFEDSSTDENSENPGTINNNLFSSTFNGLYFNRKYYEECDNESSEYNLGSCVIEYIFHSATSSVTAMEGYNGCDSCSGNSVESDLGLRSTYTLESDSPAVDSGTTVSVGDTDLSNEDDRIVDGNGDGTATIDVGCYEYQGDGN